MARCIIPYPELVFCSHLQCVQCRAFVAEDGYSIGSQYPFISRLPVSDVRDNFALRYRLLKFCK